MPASSDTRFEPAYDGDPADLRTDVVRFSATLGRELRQDPARQLGVPSEDLIRVALDRGARADALSLVRYLLNEFTITFETVLNGWLTQLLDDALPLLGMSGAADLLRVPRRDVWHGLFALGRRFHAEAAEKLESCDDAGAELGLEHVRMTFRLLNDETVRFIQDILTALADAYGEDEPVRALRKPYELIWRERYGSWEQLTALEKLQLSCEGMRTHFGGQQRRGEFKVVEEHDRYRMIFAPCGTGGILRRGDPESGAPPWDTHGRNTIPKPYSWHRTGVPWYCMHCSLYLEHWPAEDYGHPLRPVLWIDDPTRAETTEWFVYKDGHGPRPDDLARVGLTTSDDVRR